MKLSVILLLAVLPLALTQFKQPCSYGVDIMLVVDTSGPTIPGDDTLGAIKRGLSELVEIHEIGPGRDQARYAFCIYGGNALEFLRLDDDRRQNVESIKTRIGNSPFTGFRKRGGPNFLHLGVQCGIRAANTTVEGRQKLMVILMASDPDPQTIEWTTGNITLAKQQMYVSVIVIGNRVTELNLVESFATVPRAFTRLFTLRSFVADAERRVPNSFASICPIDLTTTTTTTTTPPPARPCDNCKMINGVGYAETGDCFSYYQCILQDNLQWLEFRRQVAVGSYWSPAMLTGVHPQQANCPTDPCNGRADGTVIGGYNNCRAKITCAAGSTLSVECCPEGQGLINGRCAVSGCNDVCNSLETTEGLCYLSPDVDGRDNRFMANDGDFSQSMPCPHATFYNDAICGCDHVDGEVQFSDCLDNAEVDLQFGPGGQVFDISRNRYSITTENFSTRETSSGRFVGVFDGNTRVRISNSNSGLNTELTLKVTYTPTQRVANAAVVSDAECPGTFRTISVIDDSNVVRGFLRTVPDDQVTVTGDAGSGRKEVVMEYTGHELVVRTNGRQNSAPAGVLMASTRFCDGIKLGKSRDLNGFVGDIETFQLFKCLDEGPGSFGRK